MISWLVVECGGVTEKCGGPVALAPRRDVAYFVDAKTAERDAHAFAAYKNAQHEGRVLEPAPTAELRWHMPYAWDHQIFSPLLRWGVLEWNGQSGKPGPRPDVAYFLDPDTAESDAKWFSRERDHWLAHRSSAPALALTRRAG
ncbi:hypothetical protein [Melittangium boletus]|uniref:Uncharacterized protein n=1 Tax=Melittangium boletus DSM 14713 TaxID=1294270 RepID=A0A250IQT3_9BACT|nr:hypothetical protein [Melittangium boletus]ATB33613.1 hypothetical protein MEBOL_007111 [Melittangium boletus DSM 14713]